MARLLLAGAHPEQANRVQEEFLERFNSQIPVPAAPTGCANRQSPGGLELDGVLCFKYRRKVAPDNTLRFAGRTLQLQPELDPPGYSHTQVEVQERLDGRVMVLYRGHTIATTNAPPHPVTLQARKATRFHADTPTDILVEWVSPSHIHPN